MWKLFHKAFGWDYIYFNMGISELNGVRRVRLTKSGDVYFISFAGHLEFIPSHRCKISWLTCSPDKYNKGAITW